MALTAQIKNGATEALEGEGGGGVRPTNMTEAGMTNQREVGNDSPPPLA